MQAYRSSLAAALLAVNAVIPLIIDSRTRHLIKSAAIVDRWPNMSAEVHFSPTISFRSHEFLSAHVMRTLDFYVGPSLPARCFDETGPAIHLSALPDEHSF
jgi:hypothetical protein